jgi:cysteine desulfurase family protein (TIGR01976 family)
MLESYVQVGAGYDASTRATNVVQAAHQFMDTWVNSATSGKVAFGANATTLINLVGAAYAQVLGPGDEVIIADTNHEANVGAWKRLERCGVAVKWWRIDPQTLQSSLETLDEILTPKTRLVAFPHVSNLLGDAVDVAEITRLCHARGARVFVDGVAYAPHGVIDVAAWDVDWYVLSNYKVYGPHMATLYGKHEAFAALPGPGHEFIGNDEVPRKWETGAYNYEGCAGILAMGDYVKFLSASETFNRDSVVAACRVMHDLEQPLALRLMDYLRSKPGVRLVSPARNPVGTISFTSDRVRSQSIPPVLASRQIGMRAGNMYSVRLCESLGIDPDDGVARVSLLHYNSAEEIERCIAALDEIL